MPITQTTRDKIICDLWADEFIANSFCGLCGNSGIIDTRSVRTPAGIRVGGQFYCICPNGRSLKRQGAELMLDRTETKSE